MNGISEEDLIDYLLGNLSDEKAAEITRRAAEDDELAAQISVLRAVIGAEADLPDAGAAAPDRNGHADRACRPAVSVAATMAAGSWGVRKQERSGQGWGRRLCVGGAIAVLLVLLGGLAWDDLRQRARAIAERDSLETSSLESRKEMEDLQGQVQEQRATLLTQNRQLAQLRRTEQLSTDALSRIGDLMKPAQRQTVVLPRDGMREVLTPMLTQGSPSLSVAAAYTLWCADPETSDESIYSGLRDAIEKADEVDVRQKAVAAWTKIGVAATKERRQVALDRAVAALTTGLNDADSRVRLKATFGLQGLGPDAKAAVPVLAARMQNSVEDWRVRVAAAEVILSLAPQEAEAAIVPTLIDALRQKSESVHSRALHLVVKLGPRARGMVPELIGLLEDPSPRFRRQAANALGAIGSDARAAVPALLRRMRLPHEQESVREAVIEAVKKIDPEALMRAGSKVEPAKV